MTMQPDELKALRKSDGRSQQQLADAIGISRESIGLMERGAAPIEKRTALAVRYVVDNLALLADAPAGEKPASTDRDAGAMLDVLLPLLDARYELKR